jgi:hypothetical protein
MSRRLIISDDDDVDPDDLPAAFDLYGWALPSNRMISRPADDSTLVLVHHCNGFEPEARARPLFVEPCRLIGPWRVDVQPDCVPSGEADSVTAPLECVQSRGSPHTHTVISAAAPQRVPIPEVILIDDDDVIPITPVDALSSLAPLNIFQYAAAFGHFPSGAASSAFPITPGVVPPSPPLLSESAPIGPSPSVAVTSATAPPAEDDISLSDSSCIFADREARHGDSTSSGSSRSSDSDLSGDFIDHAEPAMRLKDRKVLEAFFPLTCKRLRLARVAPNLMASRPRQKQRVAPSSAARPSTIFEVVD